MNHFYIEITDTFYGLPWLYMGRGHKVKAKTIRGAVVRLNRHSGLGFRKVADYGDVIRYDSQSGATCAFIEVWDDELHSDLLNVETCLA